MDVINAFKALVAKHQSIPNVQIASIKYGTVGVGNMSNAVKQMQGFMPPGKFDVANIRYMQFGELHEFLDYGIARAREMIDKECPQDVDFITRPWCQHKVIVVLSDGGPGPTSLDYYNSSDDDLPEKLLNDIRDDDIAVSTICVHGNISDDPNHSVSCSSKFKTIYLSEGEQVSERVLDTIAKERLEAMSEATGGKYYGEVWR